MVSLQQILASKDARQSLQRQLIQKYGKTVISFTVLAVGSNKQSSNSTFVGQVGVETIEQTFKDLIVFKQVDDDPTGFQSLFVVDLEEVAVKKLTTAIEENHKLGRLFDIDVIGKNFIPLSRESIGYAKRKCLLCDNPACECARAKVHSISQLNQQIENIISAYK
ncbi:MAG: citrate lyase holo-[acyl-carrier protein] synthase [Clostridia bacterium]